ncbi:hypothetical protein [Haloplanus aerogenes]|uniref:Uncharacterized protein n=1 Tax=Haloplanus aerogenes TaxID=660522 RepID=A0A3M0D9E8_9EURY|nr:hypothetical protein [Haloplanus aerogenes]AZH26294.1 hypothetical protein DU502_13385 [Haloplanus aerogenes]RMB18248.1 hypothetical protein ATH50_1698 [Haloplanus aerogenes]
MPSLSVSGHVAPTDADAIEEFDRVDAPTPTRSLEARAASAVETGYWSLRAFGRELRAHPRATTVFGAFVLVGGGWL